MEYFEVEHNHKKSKKKEYKYNNKNILYLLVIFSLLSIIFFLFIDYLFPSEHKKNNEEKQIKETKNINPNDSPSVIKLDNKPQLHTEFILNLLTNYNKIDFSIFETNLKTIIQKIYSIIYNQKENEDFYKILSTIYGAFLADSMGSFCEFKPFNRNNHFEIFNLNERHIFKPGQVTDDSEMAMSQAYGIMDNAEIKELNENLIYYYYLIWYNSHPLDIGTTTRKALNILKLDENNNIKNIKFSRRIKEQIAEKNNDSLSNGFLMRISPLLCWFYMVNENYIREILKTKNNEKYYELYSKILSITDKDNQLTHPNRENSVSGAIFIFLGICAMEQEYSGKEILKMLEILFSNDNFEMKSEENILKNHFVNIMTDIKKEDFNEDIYFGNLSHLMGYYLHAFKLTLYYLYKIDNMKQNYNFKDIYNNIIFSICDFGGDTDTNAAIVGMILGPLIGIKNFDNKFLDVFLNFYSKERIIYTNAFIYYYAKYLIEANQNGNTNDNDGIKINFNFYKMINDMIYKKL